MQLVGYTVSNMSFRRRFIKHFAAQINIILPPGGSLFTYSDAHRCICSLGYLEAKGTLPWTKEEEYLIFFSVKTDLSKIVTFLYQNYS